MNRDRPPLARARLSLSRATIDTRGSAMFRSSCRSPSASPIRAPVFRSSANNRRSRFIPASGELIRLYADYLNGEYGPLDSDYVFVNLWGRPHGRPLTYPAVYD